MMPVPPAVLLLAGLFVALPVSLDPTGGRGLVQALEAHADDDDDDDDDDDGSASRAGGGSEAEDDRPRSRGDGGLLRRLFGPAEPPRTVARASRPLAARDEIVVADIDDDDVDRLESEGFAVLAEAGPADRPTVRLRVPRGLGIERALARVAELAPAASADRNHYYRPQAAGACEAPVCASWAQVGWRPEGDRSCLADLTVGVVDTAVNTDHEALRQGRLARLSLRTDGQRAAGVKHGTAVVSLLTGDPSGRVPGLIPAARLLAADPFVQAGGEDRTDAFGLVAALDALAAEGARVVNLSLAGPDNRVLARRVADLLARRVVLVAAVGNDGPRAGPLYPAAYEGVIGVTAVDAGGHVYRRAGRGPHVDLAAPGVAVAAAASIRGLRPQTGTSFAAPFVTAAAAVLVAVEPDLPPDGVLARLAAAADDLGDPGRDPVYGAGLLRADGTCRLPAAPDADVAGRAPPHAAVPPASIRN